MCNKRNLMKKPKSTSSKGRLQVRPLLGLTYCMTRGAIHIPFTPENLRILRSWGWKRPRAKKTCKPKIHWVTSGQ